MNLSPARKRQRVLDIDITAMIDVVFLLIVFFMTTAQFASMTKERLDLPTEKGEQGAAPTPAIVINVTSAGDLIVAGEPASIEAVTRRVAAEVRQAGGDPGAVDLSVRADRDAPARVLNDLAENLSLAGVRSWRLATEVPQGGGG